MRAHYAFCIWPTIYCYTNMRPRINTTVKCVCIGEGNGNPLQYSCLENPRDGGAWWAAIYGVAQRQTRLKRLSSNSSSKQCLTVKPILKVASELSWAPEESLIVNILPWCPSATHQGLLTFMWTLWPISAKGQVILLKVILLIKTNITMETDPRSTINDVDIQKQQHQSWRFYYLSVEKC